MILRVETKSNQERNEGKGNCADLDWVDEGMTDVSRQAFFPTSRSRPMFGLVVDGEKKGAKGSAVALTVQLTAERYSYRPTRH